MFGAVTEKFQKLFSSLGSKKQLTEENIANAVSEVRLALLEADVSYSVASNFVKRVKEKALGEAVIKSVSPGQQFIKVVHDELVQLMGGEEVGFEPKGSLSVLMLCGLQGSGKTTHCAKLANYLIKKNKKVLLAACDLQRPAAIEQLQILGRSIETPVFTVPQEKDPRQVAKLALEKARKEGFDVLIVDTAGRLHIDEELMQQLQQMKTLLSPQEIFFVASAATGQDAVKTAAEFDARIQITGSILTMLDGSARAGAALSIREVTGKPLIFEGIGEKIGDLQLFNPHSMADRILGMGDVINLVRKAEEHISEESNKDLEKKLRKANFTYEDYLKQMGMLKKMGPLKGLLKMLPGAPDLDMMEDSQEHFDQVEAIILSMTPAERQEKVEMEPSRRRRIAKGSGTSIDDVNRVVKGFKNLKHFLKDMPSMKQKMMKLTGNKENPLWR